MARSLICLAAGVLAAAASASSVRADASYLTVRLGLRAVAGAPGGGMIVNVHANGPRIYAHEIYALQHAAVGTYVVFLNVFPTSLDCSGSGFSVPLATIETNPIGNGQADFKFTPELVADFRGMTFSISWTMAGPATYASDCTVVTLD